MLVPTNGLMHAMLLPNDTHQQSDAENSNQTAANSAENDLLNDGEEVNGTIARASSTQISGVVEGTLADRCKDGERVEDEDEQKDRHQGEIVKEKSTAFRCDETVMKDENVSLQRCEGQQDSDGVVEAPIDEPPDPAHRWVRETDSPSAEILQVKWNVHDLIDESKEEYNDQDVVGQGSTQVFLC